MRGTKLRAQDCPLTGRAKRIGARHAARPSYASLGPALGRERAGHSHLSRPPRGSAAFVRFCQCPAMPLCIYTHCSSNKSAFLPVAAFLPGPARRNLQFFGVRGCPRDPLGYVKRSPPQKKTSSDAFQARLECSGSECAARLFDPACARRRSQSGSELQARAVPCGIALIFAADRL